MLTNCEVCGEPGVVIVGAQNGRPSWVSCNRCYKVGKAHPTEVKAPESLAKFACGLGMDDDEDLP